MPPGVLAAPLLERLANKARQVHPLAFVHRTILPKLSKLLKTAKSEQMHPSETVQLCFAAIFSRMDPPMHNFSCLFCSLYLLCILLLYPPRLTSNLEYKWQNVPKIFSLHHFPVHGCDIMQRSEGPMISQIPAENIFGYQNEPMLSSFCKRILIRCVVTRLTMEAVIYTQKMRLVSIDGRETVIRHDFLVLRCSCSGSGRSHTATGADAPCGRGDTSGAGGTSDDSRCRCRRRSNICRSPSSSSPLTTPEWYTRRTVSTSSMLCVRTSASSLIFAVASLTWSSVISRPSCSTRDLTAFQPVSRWLRASASASATGCAVGGRNGDAPDGDVALEAEVLGLEDLVGRGVVQDRLGVDTGLVRECAITATSP